MKILYISGQRARERGLILRMPEVEFEEVSLHLRSSGGILTLKKLWKVYDFLRRFSPDVILIEGAALYSLIPSVMGKLFGVPTAVRFKGDIWDEYSQIRHGIPFIERVAKFLNYLAGLWVLRHAAIILPNANHFHSLLKSKLGVGKPMQTVHISFDVRGNTGGSRCDNSVHSWSVLTVSDFSFWGKVAPLIVAVKHATPVLMKYGLSWDIIGGGFFLGKLKEAVGKEIRSGTVRVLGWQDPYPFYRSALALFYISTVDGQPNVILEAAAHRLPIVINRECPATEFIQDGRDGIVLNFEDREMIQSLIERLVNDRTGIMDLGENGYMKVRDTFSSEKTSEEMRGALLKLLER